VPSSLLQPVNASNISADAPTMLARVLMSRHRRAAPG
jgi:hypothetical protein